MKFTLSWLRDHLDMAADIPPALIADTLTRIGLEVESVDNPAEALAPFKVAQIISAERHPDADKLQVCQVDIGTGTPVQVVCGAPNARAGLKVVFGPPGAYVPGLDVTLKETKIRGIESKGMLCSGRELQTSDADEGIMELPEEAPVGEAYAAWAGLDDPVFDISVTPNRQDCMGVQGIARDLAAAGLGTLLSPSTPLQTGTFPCPVSVVIEDSAGCPTFLGQMVRGVKNGPSPEWLARRLRAIGQKPISALVDITNYIMLDRGRPLHVYDIAKLSGPLRVRQAQNGESFTGLNGKTYPLTEGMTVISDTSGVIDLAGIMGGMSTGCSETTTDVLIECAYFDPVRTSLTGQALGLTSDARLRFERGVDPDALAQGLALATTMVQDLCGGEASQRFTLGEAPQARPSLAYRPSRTATLGGLTVEPTKQRTLLEALGFVVEGQENADIWAVTPPSWRRDVQGEADVVEEVLRLVGIDAVQPTPLDRPDAVMHATASPAQARVRRLRHGAAARGFHEALTWSFISAADAAAFGGSDWTLQNPISVEMDTMRPSLLPGLARAAARAQDRGMESVRLFEIGKRYLTEREAPTLALLGAGTRQGRHWQSGPAQTFTVFDAKTEALTLLELAGLNADKLTITAEAPAHFHPGRSGALKLGPKTILAHFGELHPKIAADLDLKSPVMALELYMDALPTPKTGPRTRPTYAPNPLQSLTRDFAFLYPQTRPVADLVTAVRSADKQKIIQATVFDQFSGPGVPEGRRSLALTVTLQPQEASFTEAELSSLSTRIIAAAQKVDAQLRS